MFPNPGPTVRQITTALWRYRKFLAAGGAALAALAAYLQVREYLAEHRVPEIQVISFSYYAEFDSSKINPQVDTLVFYYRAEDIIAARVLVLNSDMMVYRPWIGLRVEVVNRGNQPVTLTQAGIRAALRRIDAPPRVTSAYLAGTRAPGHDFGTMVDEIAQPRGRSLIHIVAALDFPLDSTARRLLHEQLTARSCCLDSVFGLIAAVFQDVEGRRFMSPNFLGPPYSEMRVASKTRPSFAVRRIDPRSRDLSVQWTLEESDYRRP